MCPALIRYIHLKNYSSEVPCQIAQHLAALFLYMDIMHPLDKVQ